MKHDINQHDINKSIFTEEKYKYSKVVNGDSVGRLRDLVAGRPGNQIIGRSRDVDQTRF